MLRKAIRTAVMTGLLTGILTAQPVDQPSRAVAPDPRTVLLEQPDAQRVQAELNSLLERYPPTLHGALRQDPSLLGNQAYLAPYPALVSFLNAHPEIVRNGAFYVGDRPWEQPRDHQSQVLEMWRDVMGGIAAFVAFGLGVGLLTWLVRTGVDYRRWKHLAKVQTEAHTKLLDRFTANEDLLAYIKSPAGSKFLESTPIRLDAAPKNLGAPLGRILWSVQGGVVLIAAGVGLGFVSRQFAPEDAGAPIQALAVLAVALGLGFVVSAALSFFLSRKLGLIEAPSPERNLDPVSGEMGLNK
jgi:hypothetical protein